MQASTSSPRSPLAAVIVSLFLWPACASSLSPTTSATGFGLAERAAPISRSDETVTAIRVDVGDRQAPVFARLTPADRADLAALYRVRGYAPLWIDVTGRPSRAAFDALMLLESADNEGLDPADYGMPDLDYLAAALTQLPDPANRASFDVALSTSMLRFMRHLHGGRVDPSTVGFRSIRPSVQPDFAALLRASVDAGRLTEMVDMLKPAFAQYEALRSVLIRYRQLAADADVEMDSLDVIRAQPGQPLKELEALRRRLATFGDLPANKGHATSGIYEGELVEGVKRFQVRHGLPADGVIGKATASALAVPISRRIRQIELALERLRWLRPLGERRLLAINIPMFRLFAWDVVAEENEPSTGMGVIVGRAVKTQTPVLLAEMREVIFRPYWNVPRSIVRNEILPILARDPGYLEREGMEILRNPEKGDEQMVEPTPENLARLERGTLRLRQRPGPRNALGLVKFVFPNEADVYMHGTPAPQLFKENRRDFSHGCVRVEDPVGLAEWVLKDDSQWTRERILAAMYGAKTFTVTLARPIDVLLFYTTAAVMPEDGAIHFAADIYGHDAALNKAIISLQAESE